MNPWWVVPFWGVLGALVGAALFELLAWGVGLRWELLAHSALAAICVPFT